MPAHQIRWSINVSVVGGPARDISQTLAVQAIDDIAVQIDAAGGAGATKTVEVQPGGEGRVQFLLVTADSYAEPALTYKVDGGDAYTLDARCRWLAQARSAPGDTQKNLEFTNTADTAPGCDPDTRHQLADEETNHASDLSVRALCRGNPSGVHDRRRQHLEPARGLFKRGPVNDPVYHQPGTSIGFGGLIPQTASYAIICRTKARSRRRASRQAATPRRSTCRRRQQRRGSMRIRRVKDLRITVTAGATANTFNLSVGELVEGRDAARKILQPEHGPATRGMRSPVSRDRVDRLGAAQRRAGEHRA
jgi:hypothetical protein